MLEAGTPSRVWYFNSIKVRLNLATMKHILKKGFDFNSIKVRLNLLNKGGDYKKEDISIP